MYDPARWQSLCQQFQTTFNAIYGIPTQPVLSLTASAGMASLKLAACATGLPHESADGVDVVMESATAEPHSTASRSMVLPIPSLAASPPIHNSLTTDPSIPSTSDASPLHSHPDHPQRNVDCPTCAPYVAVLAKDVPYSHHTNSSIVCRISGEVIGDENYALAFPNGYVYSHKVCLVPVCCEIRN
jgi:macrophage erythroblast attacher